MNIEGQDYEIYVHEIMTWFPSIKKLDENFQEDSQKYNEYSKDDDEENDMMKMRWISTWGNL